MGSRALRTNWSIATLAAVFLFIGTLAAEAQQQVNMTATTTSITLPDGSAVPMWGYSCGPAVTGSTATCAKLNQGTTNWSPVVITVPTGQGLTVNLTNSLPVPPGALAGIPTSLVIVGQIGAGLGSAATYTPSPSHTNAQANATWPIANTGVSASPPAQSPRIQSFSTEVATGQTTALTWSSLRPGTYLLESGTHPSIQGPMGLYGMVVVTSAPAGSNPGTAYPASGSNPAVVYNQEIPLLFSEIDPVQNAAVNAAVNTANFSETMVWSGQPGGCGNPSSSTYHQCYPPAVNYTPLYYLINGVAFDKNNPAISNFASLPVTGAAGSVLVRMVNAGLRMHVPSIVGASTGSSPGFTLMAEDGNTLPGSGRVQSDVFMAAGKTFDVMIDGPATCTPATPGTTCTMRALPVFDRQLSLSGNSTARDGGMLAYISINGNLAGTTNAGGGSTTGIPGSTLPNTFAATVTPDTYNSLIAGQTFTVSDPSRGVIANDINVYGVQISTPAASGTVTLNKNGTFTYIPSGTATSDAFGYCANGATAGGLCTTVTLGPAPIESAAGILMQNATYTSNLASGIRINPPGILSADKDAAGYPLKVYNSAGVTTLSGPGSGTITVDSNGGFTAAVSASGSYTFSYFAQNSQGTVSSVAATVTLIFPTASGLNVTVLDGANKSTPVTDYRWIIEEDRTFYVDPKCQVNPPPAGCPTASIPGQGVTGIVPTLGTNFHTSYMPVVAQGCIGTIACESGQTLQGLPAVCDVGNGSCRTGAAQQSPVNPSQVHLDPTKRYYISILPGDAANPFNTGNAQSGHAMGGAPIAAGQTSVTVLTNPTPFQPAKLSVQVFEDDFPLNGEQDAGGGIDVLASNEPGLGGFNIVLFDDAGGTGDATGQMTYDMFNMPLSNSLAGTIDPATGKDACPISTKVTANATGGNGSQKGITGMIVTCPRYESDGTTLSPLAGQAVIANLMPGRYGVVATPGADRIARGEEWMQTNTLDGQKAHDSFLRIGEPAYFQEYGPAGYHVSIGFANPTIINGRLKGVCAGTDPTITGTSCTNTLSGSITTERMSRTPDERLYSSGDNSSFAFTQCYVSIGDPDGEDFAFAKCAGDGSFNIPGLPDGNWRVTVFDQWNDMLVDGLSTPVKLDHTVANSGNLGQIATNQWQANIYTNTFIDSNGNGLRDSNENGLTLVPTNIRFRDGSFSNFNNTDLDGNAGFNEVFPLFSWYVIETDATRYKNTGTHVVYDAGGPADGTPCGSASNPPTAPCGNSSIGQKMANTVEQVSLPTALRVPGAVYCAGADCIGKSISGVNGSNASDAPSTCTTNATTGVTTCTRTLSTGRIDPPWVTSEGWQGFSGQNSFIEFGKKPYAVGENGGIRGHVVYASTRPFDDPQLLLQTSWEPLVPGVTINLYQEGTAPDGSKSLKLIDTTKTSSWDDWAQGFYPGTNKPYMNCPGQQPAPTSGSAGDLFFFSLYNQPMWLDMYGNSGIPAHAMPNNSQFKCYDGMHNWNQVQPAPYDGMYQFPSVTGLDPNTGRPTGTNCDPTVCIPDPDTTDPYRHGLPMLPAGKYVVEIVVPPGYELVKEEDKNILIGDNYIAPVTQQFGPLANIFILPDQAAVAASYNASNAQNPTTDLGAFPRHEGDTGSVESFWPCVGEPRVVPDYISLFPQSREVAPFAGATRNLCDRKEVTLTDQASALAKFYIFTSTHAAAHFTGIITDDFTSEFDPFSPSFGEKFSPANLPVSIRDFNYNEISRTYSDQWGSYDGITYSTWEVNPPNPTGYAPTMMVTCMNDAGPIADPAHPGQTITDPLFNPGYSQFCYEIPFMPGQTQYMDTPVVPTSGFVGAGYNNPDCAFPASTPAISSVVNTSTEGSFPARTGPWVSAAGHSITITALGDQIVNNYGYSGPAAHTTPFNQKTVSRHYGFGTTQGTVSIGGVNVPSNQITTWNDTTIVLNVPSNVPLCDVQQQAQYGGSSAQCGELVITTAPSTAFPKGQQSVDAVTVTIGGKAPTAVAPGSTIQPYLDAAAPGDLIVVPPGTYNELLLMWKPVRLQGVGAASSIINANTHPAGITKLDPWRRSVNCLFGLALNGQPRTNANPFDSTGAFGCPDGTGNSQPGPNGNTWSYFSGGPSFPFMAVDRLPREGIVGWDTTLNGNLAEMLQEPSLMGAYEGAAITVLSKGVNIPQGAADVFGSGAEADFPAGSTLLSGQGTASGIFLSGDTNPICKSSSGGSNPYPSNFQCNPSSIDGLGITNSSQGGGGILVHGWAHNLQIANNQVNNNAGTLSGGISIGQGEFTDAYLAPNSGVIAPGSCQDSTVTNTQLPYCFFLHTNVHNNSIFNNSSTGDELFTATPAGAGGASFTTGADYYRFNNNWVCGNLSTGDGGGLGHLGFIYNGDIEHNTFLFNQSINPTIPTNGGGIIVMGAPPDGTQIVNGVATECGTVTDVDCVPGLGDGAGPGLVINANLIMGNGAESGSGGGLRFQAVNGTEVARFPGAPASWYSVAVTNNILANNVAGWDGGGISLEDSLAVNIVNNTIMSNDSTASAGVLFNTLGAPLASSQSPPANCPGQANGTGSCPQPAGLVSLQNSPQLVSSFAGIGPITCPAGHYSGTATNGTCTKISYPLLYDNIFWQNRTFDIHVGGLGTGALNQQNVVALLNGLTGTAPASQTATGQCVNGSNYWDIGVRGDTGPANHSSGFTLNAQWSLLTSIAGYNGHNANSNPSVIRQYCNGARVPPENGGLGYQVPPGISDATVPNPIFSLTPAATVDEGNNWINMSWGPLSLVNPVTNAVLGNYSLQSGSSAIDFVECSNANAAAVGCQVIPDGNGPTITAPRTDFFGNPRPDPGANPHTTDAGAIEIQGSAAGGGGNTAPTLTSISPASGTRGSSVPVTLTGTNLTGATSVTVSGSGPNAITVTNLVVVNATTATATFVIPIGNNGGQGTRTVSITTPGGTSNTLNFTVTAPPAPALSAISPATHARNGVAFNVTLTGTNLTGATAVNVSGSGVTVGALAVSANGTTITTTFTIATNANINGSNATRNVSVTTPGGSGGNVSFTITP